MLANVASAPLSLLTRAGHPLRCWLQVLPAWLQGATDLVRACLSVEKGRPRMAGRRVGSQTSARPRGSAGWL
eukprot:2071116-Alexandrium_andersonii.AAC.1